MPYGATATGFVPATLDEIRTELFQNLSMVTDSQGNTPFLNASDDSILGQIMSIFAEGLAKCWNAAYLTSTQFDPAQAVGQYLTGLVQLNGLLRKPGGKTRIQVDIGGIAGTVVPAGSVLTDETTQRQFTTDEEIIVPGTVTATATVFSSWVPAAGEINLIQSPIPGVNQVNNTGIVTYGEDRETDAALRFRQQRSTAFPARSTIESIAAGIWQVSGVVYCRVYQNITMQNPDDRGIPAKEICPMVYGGDDDEIAEVCFNRYPVGKVGYGNVTRPVKDEYGYVYNISFSRPKLVPITMQVALGIYGTMREGWQEEIKRNIMQFARMEFPPGADIINSRLYSPINRVPGHMILFIRLARDGNTPTQNNVPIAF